MNSHVENTGVVRILSNTLVQALEIVM